MADTPTGASASPPAPTPKKERFRRTRSVFRWFGHCGKAGVAHAFGLLQWMRDHNSDSIATREHYANFGVWTSRIYALVLPLVVALVSWLVPRVSYDAVLWATLIWCVGTSFGYLWYQGKEILAYPVVEEKHANRDLMNSILPAISVALLVGAWILLFVLHVVRLVEFDFTYSVFGWVIIASAGLNVLYDLRVNTRVTLVLSKVPARQEFNAPPAPRE